MPSSSSSKTVRRYISVVSIRPCAVTPVTSRIDAMPREGQDVPVSDGLATIGRAGNRADSYPRAERWRTATVLAQLADITGIVLTDAGRCPGGQIGASYVRW